MPRVQAQPVRDTDQAGGRQTDRSEGGGRTDREEGGRPPAAGPGRRSRGGGIRGHEARDGWLFVAPAVLLLVVFLAVPVLMALWVSFTGWNGFGSPFSAGTPVVGVRNYSLLLSHPGLPRDDFVTSIRNTFYYMLFVVPLQTGLALFLALVVNSAWLKGKGFFRAAFFFPSVTSSVAISVVFLFIFTTSGAANTALNAIGVRGPNWFNDPRGLFQVIAVNLHLVGRDPPAALAEHGVLGLSWWDWLSGPSIALCTVILLVVWTTSGTFMLIYLAALQNIPREVEEAGLIDGAGRWQTLRYILLPMLKPTTFLILTLGLIATWQVFDQIFITTQGGPDKTSMSPALLSYAYGFGDHAWGPAAAMAFVLFAIIIVLTLLQQFLMRDRDAAGTGRRLRHRRGRPDPNGRDVHAH